MFGKQKDIYNPWSIINFLDKKELWCRAYKERCEKNIRHYGFAFEGKEVLIDGSE